MTARRVDLAGAGAAGTALALALVRGSGGPAGSGGSTGSTGSTGATGSGGSLGSDTPRGSGASGRPGTAGGPAGGGRWSLGEIACRTVARAAERCAILGSGRPVDLATLTDPSRPAPAGPLLLVLAVPDRIVPELARQLARRRWPPGTVAIHLSGSVEVEALSPLRAAGVEVGGLHPLKSFVDPERDAATLRGTYMAVEGEGGARGVLQDLVDDLGGRAVWLAPGARRAWHGGATHAANHLVALVDQAIDLMALAGLGRDEARAALLPLLSSALGNLERLPPREALTGPVVRGDVGAVRRHLAALEALPADVRDAYRALARRAVVLARARGLPAATAAELEELLRPDAADGGEENA